MSDHEPQSGRTVAWANAGVSVLLAGGLAAAYAIAPSKLLLAQAADSVVDVLTTGALLWAVRVSARPADHDHPIGHQRVEPLAALLVALVAGVLAAGVVSGAVDAITAGEHPVLPAYLAAAFALKCVAKGIIFAVARRQARALRSPALDALALDALNDVLVNGLSLVGFAIAAWGWPAVDPWLAIPAALWIAWAALSLARENIRYLMGEAPSDERRAEIGELASQVEGVLGVGGVLARHHGQDLDVTVDIQVEGTLTVVEAHAIGEAVKRRLLEEPDVAHVEAHIDAFEKPPTSTA